MHGSVKTGLACRAEQLLVSNKINADTVEINIEFELHYYTNSVHVVWSKKCIGLNLSLTFCATGPVLPDPLT